MSKTATVLAGRGEERRGKCETHVLLFLSIGSGRHQFETAYSALTLKRFGGLTCDLKIVTDTPSFFQVFGLPVEVISATQAREWAGPHNYMPRGKIKAMELAFRATQFQKVILVDGDTYFTKRPERLFERVKPGRGLMYDQECPLGYGKILDYQEVARVGRKILDSDARTGAFACDRRTMQWNSGVVGLHRQDAGVLSEVLAVNDLLSEHLKFWAREQTAFSLVLASRVRLRSSRDCVFHYNASAERLAFDDKIRALLDASGGSPRELEAKELYRHRLAETSWRRRVRLCIKRCFVGTGLWGHAMRARWGLGRCAALMGGKG